MNKTKALKRIWEELKMEEAERSIYSKTENQNSYYQEGLDTEFNKIIKTINTPYQKQLREEIE
jgi:hypothetical protein